VTNLTTALLVITIVTKTQPVKAKKLFMVKRYPDSSVLVTLVSIAMVASATQKLMNVPKTNTDVTNGLPASINQLVMTVSAMTDMSVMDTNAPFQSTNVLFPKEIQIDTIVTSTLIVLIFPMVSCASVE
jgi:uncharacterized membrane protein (DUF485 family)